MTFYGHVLRLSALALVLIIPLAASAQWDKKAYTEWSEKEAQKVLEKSPWGQTQILSDTSKEFSTGISRTQGSSSRESGDYSDRHVNVRIRFLSSKPIRQAFSRVIEINQKGVMNAQLAAQLKALATADFPDYIIVSVDVDSKESRGELQQVRSLLDNRRTADLKNVTYLSSGGQRVFLAEYQPPKKDGLGAKFIFPRMLNGKPFLTPENNEVQFYSEFSDNITLNMRFKVKDMTFNGKLEY